MKYGEALKQIMEGNDVTRGNTVLSFEDETGLVTIQENGKMTPFKETKEDRDAQDWEVVKK